MLFGERRLRNRQVARVFLRVIVAGEVAEEAVVPHGQPGAQGFVPDIARASVAASRIGRGDIDSAGQQIGIGIAEHGLRFQAFRVIADADVDVAVGAFPVVVEAAAGILGGTDFSV